MSVSTRCRQGHVCRTLICKESETASGSYGDWRRCYFTELVGFLPLFGKRLCWDVLCSRFNCWHCDYGEGCDICWSVISLAFLIAGHADDRYSYPSERMHLTGQAELPQAQVALLCSWLLTRFARFKTLWACKRWMLTLLVILGSSV